MSKNYPILRSAQDLENRVLELGFLPFFRNAIPGFSVEEMADPDLWFRDDVDGPWEWKGPVARRLNVAYGKMMSGKALFVSRKWYPLFALWRRAARPLPPNSIYGFGPTDVLRAIEEYGPVISTDLKKMFEALPRRKRTAADLVDLTGLDNIEYKANRNALERALTVLQMSGHILIQDFQYAQSHAGKPYGWGLALYNTPEAMFGPDFMTEYSQNAQNSQASNITVSVNPAQAMHLMYDHLHHLLPRATDRQLYTLLK